MLGHYVNEVRMTNLCFRNWGKMLIVGCKLSSNTYTRKLHEQNVDVRVASRNCTLDMFSQFASIDEFRLLQVFFISVAS